MSEKTEPEVTDGGAKHHAPDYAVMLEKAKMQGPDAARERAAETGLSPSNFNSHGDRREPDGSGARRMAEASNFEEQQAVTSREVAKDATERTIATRKDVVTAAAAGNMEELQASLDRFQAAIEDVNRANVAEALHKSRANEQAESARFES